MYSKARTFSHVYVESAVSGHPRTRRILDGLRSATVVPVDDYQNIFGRGRQDFWRQKASPKLVLARKKDNFIYPGNDFLQSNLSPNFGYNALVLNCPYDCHYCYLQGMYPSANIVAFVNLEEYFSAAEDFLLNRPDPGLPAPLAVSYDTDLLALEGVLGYVEEWLEWSRAFPDLLMEVRTKSAGKRFFREKKPSPSVRLAWTLSPAEICERYETGAPGLEARLAAMETAVEYGWRVSVCIDPVLRIPGWRECYGMFLEKLASRIALREVERAEVGVFRISSSYFRRMQRRPGTDLLHYPYEHANNAVSYKKTEREEMVEFLGERLAKSLSKDRIHLWT